MNYKDETENRLIAYFFFVQYLIVYDAYILPNVPPTQDRPTGSKEPGVRPILQHRAGNTETDSAEVAVGDRGPLGLWTRLCPGGQTGATLQTPLQWTLTDFIGTFTHLYCHDDIVYLHIYFFMSLLL